MAHRRHSQNKYSKPVKPSAVFKSLPPAPTVFQINLEISPDHSATLDFSFSAKRPQMQKAFIEMFNLIGDSLAPITKVSFFYATRDFSMFLDDYEEKNGLTHHETYDIDLNLLLNFKLWLETRPLRFDPKRFKSPEESVRSGNRESSLSASTIHSVFRKFTLFLKKMKNHRPEWLPHLPAKLPRWSRPSGDWKPANDVLGVKDLKNILAAAKCETDRRRAEYDQFQQILKQSETLPVVDLNLRRPNAYWKEKDNLIHSLIRENGLAAPVSNKIHCALTNHHKISPAALFRMYVPTGEASLLPFALQLYILTALNVTSLMTLTRDCIEDFVLPQYKKLRYDKPRSGTGSAKSQLLPAYVAKSNAEEKEDPIEIIGFLLRWTEPLIEHAEKRLRNYLFLYRVAHRGSGRRNVVRVVWKFGAFDDYLEKFIGSYHESHQLPNFCLSDLRPAVATYIYLQTRDIFRVQRFLGHKNIKTTIAYIRGRVIAAEHDKSMADAIEQVIRRIIPKSTKFNSEIKHPSLPILAILIEGESQEGIDEAIKSGRLPQRDAELLKGSGMTTLVARCRQPYNPPAYLNVPPGKICTKIFKCLFCPNAVVLEEDLPEVLMRIADIWEERNRLSEEGWQILYVEAWLVLNQVVRLFSKEAVERATKQVAAKLFLSSKGALSEKSC